MRLQRCAEKHKTAQLKSFLDHCNQNEQCLKRDDLWPKKKTLSNHSVVIPDAFKQSSIIFIDDTLLLSETCIKISFCPSLC